jgi:hypothetical protein
LPFEVLTGLFFLDKFSELAKKFQNGSKNVSYWFASCQTSTVEKKYCQISLLDSRM